AWAGAGRVDAGVVADGADGAAGLVAGACGAGLDTLVAGRAESALSSVVTCACAEVTASPPSAASVASVAREPARRCGPEREGSAGRISGMVGAA
ncbi:MAG: hypothetical protein ABF665_18725, partial [Gluconacetobacter sp.]